MSRHNSRPELPPREEPIMEPINEQVQPPVVPSRPGRVTNQLQLLQRTVLLALWNHKYARPFHEPVDTIKHGLSVSLQVFFLLVFQDRLCLGVTFLRRTTLKSSSFHGSGNCEEADAKQLLLECHRLHSRHQQHFL
jgi:hypothetical protein